MAEHNLSTRAILVSLNVSQWAARRLDRVETQKLRLHHNMSIEAARVNKDLLPMTPALEHVHKKTGAIRTYYYAATVPWAGDNQRIIRVEAYMDFAERMGADMREWRDLVEEFFRVYPEAKTEARRYLNGIYKEEDYPDVSELRHKFQIGMSYMPVPDAGHLVVDLSDEILADMRKSIEEGTRKALGGAMKEAREKLFELVQKTHERLSDPSAIFRDSLVSNALDLCKLLPGMNIDGDPQLDIMRQQLERSICQHNPGTLREDPLVRSQVADEMKSIMDKMSGLYGMAA
jgi:hypothetical protein